jgi:hypothetical protein
MLEFTSPMKVWSKTWLRIIFFALLNLCCLQGFSQQKSLHELSLYGGMQLMSERDKGYSPLLYRGSRPYLGVAFRVEKTHKEMEWMVTFGEGMAENRYGHAWEVATYAMLASNYFRKNASQRFQWGWANLNSFDQRVNPRFANFNNRSEYFTAVGPSVKIHHPITWRDRRLIWETRAYVQMLGFIIASDYVLSEPRGFRERNGVKGFFNMLDPFILGRDWAVGGISGLSYQMGSGNTLGIQYRYDFHQLATIHPVQRSRGAILLVMTVLL